MKKLILFTAFVAVIVDVQVLQVASAHYLAKGTGTRIVSSRNDLVSATESLASSATSSSSSSSSSLPLEKYSPEIVNELRDFVNLIPAATVDEIAAKHYIVDGDFRKAMKFLRSGEFNQLVQHVQQIPRVIEILRYVHLLVGNSTTDDTTESHNISKLDKTLEDLLLKLSKEDLQIPLQPFGAEYVIVDANPLMTTESLLSSRGNIYTFTSFVAELLQHLPRSRYVDMINEKCQRSAAFKEFYRALRSDQLKNMVDVALISSDLSSTIATLKAYDIDGPALVKIGFLVLSWGLNTTNEIHFQPKLRILVHRRHY